MLNKSIYLYLHDWAGSCLHAVKQNELQMLLWGREEIQWKGLIKFLNTTSNWTRTNLNNL